MCQLYHGEKKMHYDDMITIFSLAGKQQIPILSYLVGPDQRSIPQYIALEASMLTITRHYGQKLEESLCIVCMITVKTEITLHIY